MRKYRKPVKMSDWGGAQQLKLVSTLIIHVQVSLNSCEAMWSASNLQGPRHHLSRRQYGEESKRTQELHRLDTKHTVKMQEGSRITPSETTIHLKQNGSEYFRDRP